MLLLLLGIIGIFLILPELHFYFGGFIQKYFKNLLLFEQGSSIQVNAPHIHTCDIPFEYKRSTKDKEAKKDF